MQKLNTITGPFLEILLICHFLTLLPCPCMPDHTQKKLQDQTVTFMNVQLNAKTQCNNINLLETTGDLLFRTLWASPGMPNHIQKKIP